MKFSGVMIGSADSHALGAFYTKILGEPSFQDGDWYGFGDDDSGFVMIGSHSEINGKSAQPQRMMLMFDVEDVQATFEKFVELGVRVVAEPYQPDPGMWLATLEDIDGNYFQISLPMPDDM